MLRTVSHRKVLFEVLSVCVVRCSTSAKTHDVEESAGERINPAPREMRMKTPALRTEAQQLTWLALDEDQAARSRRVEQVTAL